MDKPAIKKFAIWARNKLIADTKYRAGLVGVTETTVAEPLPQSNESVQFFDVGLPQPYRIEDDAVTQRQRFVAELNKETAKQGSYTAAYQTVVDKVAYTWFNRLIAVRYMEVNDLLPSRTRVLSSADGRAEPQIVTSPFDAVLDYTPAEQQQIAAQQCAQRAAAQPRIDTIPVAGRHHLEGRQPLRLDVGKHDHRAACKHEPQRQLADVGQQILAPRVQHGQAAHRCTQHKTAAAKQAKQHLMQRFPHRVAFHKGKAHQQKPRKQGPKPCRQALFRAFFARR